MTELSIEDYYHANWERERLMNTERMQELSGEYQVHKASLVKWAKIESWFVGLDGSFTSEELKRIASILDEANAEENTKE